MPVNIRPMTVEDFPAVFTLGMRSYDVLEKPYNFWSLTEVADHLQNHPGLCFVATAESGEVVGFALGADSYEAIEEAGHLEWIAVAAGYRRQGIASRLFARLEEEFRRLGKRSVVVDISKKNRASVGAALKAGFSEGITVTFYQKDL